MSWVSGRRAEARAADGRAVQIYLPIADLPVNVFVVFAIGAAEPRDGVDDQACYHDENHRCDQQCEVRGLALASGRRIMLRGFLSTRRCPRSSSTLPRTRSQ